MKPYALCCFCDVKLTNTKRLVFSHLKYCRKFAEQYNEDERNRILFPETIEEPIQYSIPPSFNGIVFLSDFFMIYYILSSFYFLF